MENHEQEIQYWKDRYFSILNQNQELRDQNKELSDNLAKANELINGYRFKIDEYEQELSIRENVQSPSTMTPSDGIEDLAKTLCTSNNSIQVSINRALTFRRQVAKEYEPGNRSKSLPSNFQEEIHSPAGPAKMYEEFYILGIKPDKASYVGNLDPEILFQFPQRNILPSSPQTRVIGNFCFPNGAKAKFIKFSESVSRINEVIYTQYDRNNHLSFVFTLKSEGNEKKFDFNEMANRDKEVLYCCCVVVDDLVSDDEVEDEQILAPKCYCIVSYCPCFELHFGVLYSLLSIKKIQRQSDISLAELTQISSQSIEEMLQNEQIMNDEQLGLLEEYYSAYTFNPGEQIFINLQSVDGIEYDIPQDLSRLDALWFCPLLFSLLDFNDFFFLLCAIMLEKSVIFVSSNYDIAASCVLGFHALLRPFSWPHLITPILPDSLRDVLEAPVPFIIGLPSPPPATHRKYSHIIWVMLDEPKISKRVLKSSSVAKSVKEPYANDIKKYLFVIYKTFQGNPCFSPSAEQQECALRIIQEIKRFWRNIIDMLPPKPPRIAEGTFLDIEDIGNIMLKKASKPDMEFLENLMMSQLFINTVEECYGLR